MKKLHKITQKVLCIALVCVVLVTSMGAYSGDVKILEKTFYNLAETYIIQTYNEDGSVTYERLDVFANEVRKINDDIDDFGIAKFLTSYTGQYIEESDDPAYRNDILSILEFDNITVSSTYVVVKEDGTSSVSDYALAPLDLWESDDGYMRLSTTYSFDKQIGKDKYYVVSTEAYWLKIPLVKGPDALALGTTAEFDDAYTENGSMSLNSKCNLCDRLTPKTYEIDANDSGTHTLSISYDGLPFLTFGPYLHPCTWCGSSNTKLHAYRTKLTYGITIDGTKNLNAVYGHSYIGFSGDFSLSIDAIGIPSFSAGIGVYVDNYNARPVSIKYQE